jgi:hypothetical protein
MDAMRRLTSVVFGNFRSIRAIIALPSQFKRSIKETLASPSAYKGRLRLNKAIDVQKLGRIS